MTAVEEFVEVARSVSIETAAKILGLHFKHGKKEHPQPCPVDHGRDAFSFNTAKNKWNCRKAGVGGQDAIGMVAHCRDYDLKRREDFLEVCSILVQRDIPVCGERESDEDRAARQLRLEAKQRQAQADAEKSAAEAEGFREKERARARGLVDAAIVLRTLTDSSVHRYILGRGCAVPDDRWLRGAGDVTYWHGTDDRGAPLALYSGPAMVLPFIDADLTVIGCHLTWIDLTCRPKLRPRLFGLTRKGAENGLVAWSYGEPEPAPDDLADGLYEPLPTKKMRGTKKGGLLPLAGDPSAERWVGGEGIENGLAYGGWEGFRDDTFYFAAGDLGNLSGPAEASSRFAHPTETKRDSRGVERPVMVAGPVPRQDQDPDDAMWIGEHVRELVLLADGDSEPVMTAAAMARARKRHARPGRLIPIVWPRQGFDFSSMAALAATGT